MMMIPASQQDEPVPEGVSEITKETIVDEMKRMDKPKKVGDILKAPET
jgi:hypothetical protein